MDEEYAGVGLTIMETVVPAVMGLGAAALLCSVLYMCAKQLHLRNKKQHQHDTKIALQPNRRPTAVRSPSGQPPHYLKKSPSPTGTKQLGILQDQTTSPVNPQSGLKYVEHDEIQSKKQSQNKKSPEEGYMTPLKLKSHEVPVVTPYSDRQTYGAEDSDRLLLEQTEKQQCGKLGALDFKLRYLQDRTALMVSIKRCRQLPAKDGNDLPTGLNGTTQTASDPYVKLQLLPEKQHKVKTRVVRNTLNPVYDEDFTFYGISADDIENISLHFIVLSFDRYSRDDVIGEVVFSLSGVPVRDISNNPLDVTMPISPRSLKIRAQGRGELLISLCWQPAAQRLTVVLLKARNLPRMDVTGLADPYVKIYLLYNGQRIAKKKTHVKKRTLSPVFNESFAFDIPAVEGDGISLEGVSLELMLLDWDRVTKNEVIGRLELGPHSTGTALNHWNEVCMSPRRQIAEWHKLNE